jgi:hypothetical protein
MKSGSSDAQQKATQDDNIRAQIRAIHPSMSEEDVDGLALRTVLAMCEPSDDESREDLYGEEDLYWTGMAESGLIEE